MTAQRANRLRELHRPGDPLILVNVWDVASARVVAATDGCQAIATASWSVAAAHGYPDREEIPLELVVAAVERIAAAVDLPVTADIESGYGDSAAEVSDTVAAVIAAGGVGVNLEDRLRPVEEHAAILTAVRERGAREGVPLVINGRSDEFVRGERSADEAIARGRAYLDAGADCFFVPGMTDGDDIRRLVKGLDGAPVNVLANPSSPPLEELAAAGVARVSFGPGPMGVAYSALGGAAATLLAKGPYPPSLAERPGR